MITKIVKRTLKGALEAHIMQRAAALSYTTLFSLAPTFLIAIGLVGIFYGRDAAEGRIFNEISQFMGTDAANSIQNIIRHVSFGGQDVMATIIGSLLFFLGLTTTFSQLKHTLNEIWSVRSDPDSNNLLYFLKTRLLSLALIMTLAFLLLVSLIVSAFLAKFGDLVSQYLLLPGLVLKLINGMVSLTVISVFFSLTYKILPDVYIEWKSALMGGLITTLLFFLGKYLIAIYLGHSNIANVYGVAGSLVVILVWVYYSSLVIFLGAVITRILIESHNGLVHLKKNAIWVKKEYHKKMGGDDEIGAQ